MSDEALDQEGNTPEKKEDTANQLLSKFEESQKAMLEQLNNLKAEMNRKIDNLKPPAPKQPEVSPEDQDMAWMESPSKQAQRLAQEIKTSTRDEVLKEVQQQQRDQQIQAQIYSDYPELKDTSSPLYKRAEEIYKANNVSGQLDTNVLRYAVAQAAVDLGAQPVSKRKKDVDDFTGLSSGRGGQKTSRNKKEADLDEGQLAFAQLVGLDVKNPKVMERLKQRNNRRSWTDWE